MRGIHQLRAMHNVAQMNRSDSTLQSSLAARQNPVHKRSLSQTIRDNFDNEREVFSSLELDRRAQGVFVLSSRGS